MWPEANTAFLLIHGAGPHRPFETIDRFARGLWSVLKDQDPGLNIRWQHRLQRHEDWIENFISLSRDDKATIDFYEYYWDCYMVRDITTKEVMEWLDKASAGAREFYAKMPDLAKGYEKLGVDLFTYEEFKLPRYRMLLSLFGRLRWLILLARVSPFGALIDPFYQMGSKYIIKLLGDVVIYTTSDVRSKNYEIRQKILSGAVEELRLLLNNHNYKRIIVVGHSIGSVIAYDALNRIAQDMGTEGSMSSNVAHKISGLVTFGSPLDWIAFFFQENTPHENFVQRQILAHFHGFKRRVPIIDQEPIAIENPIGHPLDRVKWLNFYHLKDRIGGALNTYEVSQNTICEKDVKGLGEAHDCYWTLDQVYRGIARQFFQ